MAGGRKLTSRHVRLTSIVKGRLRDSKHNRSNITTQRQLDEAAHEQRIRGLSSEARQMIAGIALEAGMPDQFTSDTPDTYDDDSQWTDVEGDIEDEPHDGSNLLEPSHDAPGIERGRKHTWESLEFHHHIHGGHGRKSRADERSRLQRNRAMYAAWDSQTPALVDAYLEFKYPCNPSSNTSSHIFTVDAVDILGRKYSHPIHQAADESANCALLRAGLLGTAPVQPHIAISINCLELYHQIRRRQSSFSIQAMCKVLCALHNVTYSQTFRTQFSIAFDEYLLILRNVKKRVDHALGRDSPNWRLVYACPPCGYKLPDDPPLYPARLHAMDGNNSMKRVDGSGHADERVFESDYRIALAQVDAFKDDVRHQKVKTRASADGASPCEGDVSVCADHWQAANGTSLDNQAQVFEQCGSFISACRHGIVETLIEMNRSGELAKYGLATLDKLMAVFKHHQAVGYDIGCSFRSTVAKSSLAERAKSYDLVLAVNAFHGHAHSRQCQLNCHPLYLKGFGLEDLETCERIFSSSNSVSRLIRFSLHFHWVQFIDLHFQQWDQDRYMELSSFIFNNYKQALATIREYTPHVTRLKCELGIEDIDFEHWHAAETTYLASLRHEPESDVLTVGYVEGLQKLEAVQVMYGRVTTVQFQDYTPADLQGGVGHLRALEAHDRAREAERHVAQERLELAMNVVADLERRLGVITRWTKESPEYVAASKYLANRQWIRTVETLEGLVVQRLFELAKANLASTGYKLRKHIAKAIVRRSAAVKTALDKYNKLAPLQDIPRPKLEYSDLASYALLGEFELLKASRHDVLAQPWAIPAHREVAIMYFKIQRAHEEIRRLNVESRRLSTWLEDEDTHMHTVITSLRSSNPHLASEITTMHEQRRRVNDFHHAKLAQVYSLRGFTGSGDIRMPFEREGHSSHPAGVVGTQVEAGVPNTVLPDEDDTLLDESLRYETFVWSIRDM